MYTFRHADSEEREKLLRKLDDLKVTHVAMFLLIHTNFILIRAHHMDDTYMYNNTVHL